MKIISNKWEKNKSSTLRKHIILILIVIIFSVIFLVAAGAPMGEKQRNMAIIMLTIMFAPFVLTLFYKYFISNGILSGGNIKDIIGVEFIGNDKIRFYVIKGYPFYQKDIYYEFYVEELKYKYYLDNDKNEKIITVINKFDEFFIDSKDFSETEFFEIKNNLGL